MATPDAHVVRERIQRLLRGGKRRRRDSSSDQERDQTTMHETGFPSRMSQSCHAPPAGVNCAAVCPAGESR